MKDGRPVVLVTDADRGSALAIMRSLGRRGWRVIAAGEQEGCLGFRSRYVTERLIYPAPWHAPAERVATLLEAARSYDVDLLIPVTDDVLLPLAAARERFAGMCQVAMPDDAQLTAVADKWQTLSLARELSVPVPLSHLAGTVAEAHALAAEFSWPVVIKPQRSRLLDAASGVDVLEVAYAVSPTDLVRVMSRFEGRCAVLLQEYCPGEGHGVELLAYQGHPHHRRGQFAAAERAARSDALRVRAAAGSGVEMDGPDHGRIQGGAGRPAPDGDQRAHLGIAAAGGVQWDGFPRSPGRPAGEWPAVAPAPRAG